MTTRVIAAIASTVLVIGYALGSGLWVSTGDSWYRSLTRPPWQPPDVVFGLIWPYNFGALIAAGIAVAVGGTVAARWTWLVFLLLSVAAALGWARLFYIEQALWPSAISLGLAFLLTIPLVVTAWRTYTWAGVILLPYVVWVGLATSLAVGYAQRN